MKKKKENIESAEEMTQKEMETLLLELADTRFFKAMLRFTSIRMGKADDGLRSIDPFKNPTEMARTQGVRAGLQDLLLYIEDLSDRANGEEEKND